MENIENVTALDHLVIAAHTLEQGVAYVEDQLGVTVPFGGVHPQMGTHNHLAPLGTSAFLEIIAINPVGNAPLRPRWFDLDKPLLAQSLQQSPRLISWVVNTRNIDTLIAKAACSFGVPTEIRRDTLSWYFGLPSDGRLLGGGFLPYIIQWQTLEHPAGKMTDISLRLKSLTAVHDHPEWLQEVLSSIGAEKLIRVEKRRGSLPAMLKADFETPTGRRTLNSALF